MEIKVKLLHEDAVLPKQGREGDAAWDLVAVTKRREDRFVEYGTGIAIAVPEDHVGLLFPRSSLSNYDLIQANHVGVIDHNYRGEIKFRFKPIKPDPNLPPRHFETGDKIGQLIIIPRPFLEFKQVEELDETNRGVQGFGSSGN
jgi:dUTP pyrophosphatase